MHLDITENTQLKQIQEGFNKHYPNLWIDFYYNISNGAKGRKQKASPETIVRTLSSFRGQQPFDIGNSRQIRELENDLRDTFGLDARVLRKSGNVWVGIVYTGNWTLENQNFEGGQITMD